MLNTQEAYELGVAAGRELANAHDRWFEVCAAEKLERTITFTDPYLRDVYEDGVFDGAREALDDYEEEIP